MVQAARLLVIIVIIQSCYTGESSPAAGPDDVNITVLYTRPITFDRFNDLPSDTYYRAGTPLTLVCRAVVDRAFYHWTSDCPMNCFAKDVVSGRGGISTDYLKSTDSGNHTCSITGSKEEEGADTVTVMVVGAGIYDSNGKTALANNSLILAGTNLDFNCVSGSSRSDVGDVLDIQGRDISESMEDPFFTFTRTTGAIHVQSFRRFNSTDQGIYTCRIPNENETIVDVHVGLYPNGTNLTLEVTKPEIKIFKAGKFTLTCNTTGSPPTTVTWIKDNRKLIISKRNGPYTSYQNMTDRPSSTYVNVLDIRGDADGAYRCDVSNRLLTNHSKKLIIPDLEVTAGHEGDLIVRVERVIGLIVGVKRVIRCTSYLNHGQIMWYKTEVRSSLNTSFAPNFTVEMTLKPDSVQRLNNVEFTCKAVTVSGDVVEKKVIMKVKEFSHNVSITQTTGPSDPSEPWLTDNKEPYTLTCNSSADTGQDLMWLDPNGEEVVEDGALTVTGPVVSEENTTVNLTFTRPNASHAGTYTCVSIARDRMPSSQKSSQWNVTIKLPKPTIKIDSVPINTPHITGFEFKLMCTSLMDKAVDTDVIVTHKWFKDRNWSPVKNSTRITVFPADGEFNSVLEFSPLRKWDDGSYVCKSTVYPAPHDPKYRYLTKSDEEEVEIPFAISTFLKTSISVIYNPPEEYPDSAIGYRAASSVTLNCTRLGESKGSLSYRWSSTCKSCLARSNSKSELTQNILRTRDAGIHTCTVTDNGDRSRGSTSTHMMNTVGAGIYVEKAEKYYGMQAAQPNNTYLTIYSAPHSSTNHLRFVLWCCSNSTESYVGSITDPNGITHTRHFKDLRVYRYSSGSNDAGCIKLDSYKYYWYPLNYDSGVYTCTIPDASGRNQTVHFGLYDYNTENVATISNFNHSVDNNSILTLICETKSAPPTEIIWLKGEKELIVGESATQKTQKIADRNSSRYVSTISIEGELTSYISDYTVIVGNSTINDTETIYIEGIKVIQGDKKINVGDVYVGKVNDKVTFNCSSDLFPMRIEWYRNDTLLSVTEDSSISETIDIISTDHHEIVYSCQTFGHNMEHQEINFTISTKVPDDWASVVITDPTDREPLHDNHHTLLCSVTAIPGLTIVPDVQWYYPDGSQVQKRGQVRVGSPDTNHTSGVTTLSLHFSPVRHDDGGNYTCKANVSVPWMDIQPPQKEDKFKMVVTTQAHMQLRIEALPHCSTWEYGKAKKLENAIMKEIEAVVQDEECGRNFSFSEIHSGEFSCRTRRDAVTYRAIVNGSSETCNATEIVKHIEKWKTEDGTLRFHKFRLQLTTGCPVDFKSFSELECMGDQEAECNSKEGGLLFDSSTCYRFKSCNDDSDDGSA